MKVLFVGVLVFLALLSIGYSSTPNSIPLKRAPDNFQVTFQTTKGEVQLNVTRSWSPYGVDRFYTLLNEKYYNDNGFFRVIAKFVAQFGINGHPEISAKWENKDIPNDPVVQSNLRGFVSFAAEMNGSKAYGRTTQLFINYVDNSYLDTYGFTPFAFITQGMSVIDSLYSDYGETPDQGQIYKQGNSYLSANFPKLDYLKTAVIGE